MGPYCEFCGHRCFVALTKETPVHILKAYGKFSIAATCPGGQRLEKEKLGFCYADIKASQEAREISREHDKAFDEQFKRDVMEGKTRAHQRLAPPFEIDLELSQTAADLIESGQAVLEAADDHVAVVPVTKGPGHPSTHQAVLEAAEDQVDHYLMNAKGHIEQAIEALSEFDSSGGDLGYPWVKPYQKALQAVDRDLGLELKDYYGRRKGD